MSIGKLNLKIRGQFLETGEFEGGITGALSSNWSSSLELKVSDDGGEQISGILEDLGNGQKYHFIAIPNRFHSRNNPALAAGKYTAVIPSSEENLCLRAIGPWIRFLLSFIFGKNSNVSYHPGSDAGYAFRFPF